jgi:hypothetical protein
MFAPMQYDMMCADGVQKLVNSNTCGNECPGEGSEPFI